MPKKFRTSKDKKGSSYTHPITNKRPPAPSSKLSRQSSIPMVMPQSVSDGMDDARANLIAGLPMAPPSLQRTASMVARREALKGGFNPASGPSASAMANRQAFIGGMGGSPFIKGYGAGSIGGRPSAPPNRVDTHGPRNVGKTIKSSGIKHGSWKGKWSIKARDMLKEGQIMVVNNDDTAKGGKNARKGRDGGRRYAIVNREKAIHMVEKIPATKGFAGVKTFRKRLTDKKHTTYKNWEIHTNDKQIQSLFGIK